MHASARTKSLLLALSSLLVIAVLSEIGLRIAGLGYGQSPHEGHPVLHHVHPRDYRQTVYSRSGEYGPHAACYDADGRVADPEGDIGQPPDTPYRFAFLGDSFVASLEVPYRQNFVALLEQAATDSVSVRNYGVASYSPAIHTLLWNEAVADWRPTHVLLLLFSNDIRDDEYYTAKGEFASDGTLIAVPDPGAGWFTRNLRKLYLARLVRTAQQILAWRLSNKDIPGERVVGGFVEENPELTELTTAYVRRLADEVKGTGAGFVLMAVPSKYRITHPDVEAGTPEFSERWRDWAAENGIAYLDLEPAFKDSMARGESPFFEKDMHFSPAGHRVIAHLIATIYPSLFPAPDSAHTR